MLVMKRGDLMPPLRGTCLDGTDPVDLSTASAINVVAYTDGATLFKRLVTGGSDGRWQMLWVAGDTDHAGDLLLEVEVTWPGNRPQTFPADGYETVRVEMDLG